MIVESYMPSFPNGKRKAFTLSYDDACRQDARLIGMMEKYGICGTFNLISGRWNGTLPARATPDEIRVRYDRPFIEVATHGETHPAPARLDPATAALDLMRDRVEIETLFGRTVTGHAYPFGSVSNEVAALYRSCGIRWARTVNSTRDFRLPADPMLLDPSCHHDDPALFDLAERFAEKAPMDWEEPWLFYVWGHTYEFDGNDNWDRMERLLKAVSGRDDVWYAANGAIMDYLRDYGRLEKSIDGKTLHNPTAQDLWLLVGLRASGDLSEALLSPERRTVSLKVGAGETVHID